MKTKKNSAALVNLKLFLVLSLIVTGMIVLASCSNNKKSEAQTELTPPPPVDQVYNEADEMPIFKGGDAALLKYIAENTKYPEQAKLNGITGRVIVKLVVEKDGSVSNVELAKSANPLLDEEAVRVVNTVPAFEKAGIKDGKKVRVSYMVPITFALN